MGLHSWRLRTEKMLDVFGRGKAMGMYMAGDDKANRLGNWGLNCDIPFALQLMAKM